MRIPRMSKTVLRFSKPITKRDNVQTVVNFKPVNTFIDGNIQATITTPDPEELQVLDIDSSLKYKLCHSVDEITINDRFIPSDSTTEYKVISEKERDLYGYYRVIGEEVKV